MVTLTIDGTDRPGPGGHHHPGGRRQRRASTIPSLCYLKGHQRDRRLPDVRGGGGGHRPAGAPPATTQVEEGMVVHTNSPRVRKARRTNMELILSQHDSHCTTCVRSGNCPLQKLANDLNIHAHALSQVDAAQERWTDISTPLIRQASKCIKCMRCVQICDKVQSLGIWDVAGTGSRTTVDVSGNRTTEDSDCAFCGQCVTHCPTGALHGPGRHAARSSTPWRIRRSPRWCRSRPPCGRPGRSPSACTGRRRPRRRMVAALRRHGLRLRL